MLRWVARSHLVGRRESATPEADGPRNCGQFCAVAGSAAPKITKAAKFTKVTKGAKATRGARREPGISFLIVAFVTFVFFVTFVSLVTFAVPGWQT